MPGSGISSPKDLWDEVLDQVDAPDSTETHSEESQEFGKRARASIQTLLPGFKGKAGGSAEKRDVETEGETEIYNLKGLKEAVDHIKKNNYVLLIDDFHYIERSAQEDIAEAIKEAARREISICVALVPHRSDDLVRANSDLRGRVQTLNVGYWDKHDLKKIAHKGFAEVLGLQYDEEAIDYLAQEAAGSPQLMQRLCLETCYEADLDREQHQDMNEFELNGESILNIVRSAVEYADHETTFEVLDSGPKTRGTERTTYQFGDSQGDVYRCLLRSIAADPPKRSFTYDELKSRTSQQCIGDTPSGSSIVGSCKKMDELVKERFPDERALEWDDTKQSLHIPDPYLLFYLRWSGKLDMDLNLPSSD